MAAEIDSGSDPGRERPLTAPLLKTAPMGAIMPFRLSIIMAAYNEERTIAEAVAAVLENEYPCDVELIVIDDGSTDGTPELLATLTDPRVIVHRHEANRGKGAALLSATARATGKYVIPFDADLEYDPEDISRMLEPVLKGRCSVVYGTRLFGCNTVYRSYWFGLGNRVLTRFANVLYNAYISDLHTCLKLIPTQMLRSMTLRETGFGLDTEITAALLRAGIRPFEVPVSYFSRSRSEGKKINWRDAIECVWILLRVRMRRSTMHTAAEVSHRGVVAREVRARCVPLAKVDTPIGRLDEEYVEALAD